MKQIAFIGAPNVGKSSLFSRIAGVYAPVGNWAGLTVTVNQAKVPLADQLVTLLDLPGFYGLSGGGEDEQLAQKIFAQANIDVWVLVMNAAQLPRQKALLEAISAKQLPLIVVLNQLDEAQRLGIYIDHHALELQIGVPVIPTSSKACVGLSELKSAMIQALTPSAQRVSQPLSPSSRWLAQVWLAPEVVSDQLTERLDHWLLHPVWGIPFFIAVMTLLFQAVFWAGAWLQDGLSDGLTLVREELIHPNLLAMPSWLSAFLLDGLYEGVATLLSFVPLVALFFFMMALLSESGYLARMAFLADNLMARFGLEGRSLVLTVMGMGCNVPAVLGARIIPDKRMRFITQLTMPFALCSARFQVFIFIAAALFAPWQAAFVVMGLYALSIVATLVTAWISQLSFKHIPYEPVVFEMPSYRLPSVRGAWLSVKFEVIGFVQRASWLIIVGVVAIWGLLNLPLGVDPSSADSYAAQIGHALSPLFNLMGLPEVYVIALLFGLVAKEVVLGGLMVLMGVSSVSPEDADAALSSLVQNNLPPESALALMAFILLYAPCLATLAVMKKEGGWRLVTSSLLWSFSLAFVVSVFIYQLGSRW